MARHRPQAVARRSHVGLRQFLLGIPALEQPRFQRAIQVTAIRLTEPIAAIAMIMPRLKRIARGGRARIASISGSSRRLAGQVPRSRRSPPLTGLIGSGDPHDVLSVCLKSQLGGLE